MKDMIDFIFNGYKTADIETEIEVKPMNHLTPQEQADLINANRKIFEHNLELQKEIEALKIESAEQQRAINTLHNLCVSAEKRALAKFKEETALPELIAVAQAAVTLQDILEKDFDYRPDDEAANVYAETRNAIQALRATGKVEL